MKKLTFVLFCVLMFSFVNVGLATTAGQTTFQVTANVVDSCTISSENLSFGQYGGLSSSPALDATATVTYACTNGTGGNMFMGQGLNPAADSTATAPRRQMKGATYVNNLEYGLYTNVDRNVVWGPSDGNGQWVTGTGESATLTVYGRVLAGQTVKPDSYTDTVTVTVEY